MGYLVQNGFPNVTWQIIWQVYVHKALCMVLTLFIFNISKYSYFEKSLKLNRSQQPKNFRVITIDLLTDILLASNHLESPIVFAALYSLAYFFRVSNMLPHSVSSFDPTRQLARGDVISFSNLGAPNVVKWSKTIQNRNDIYVSFIPNLGKSPLCPCTLLKKELESTSGDSNQPLFTLYRTLGPVPLMDSVGGRHLKQISAILHLTPSLKFHDFRRSDATWAFHNGVSLDHNNAPWDLEV